MGCPEAMDSMDLVDLTHESLLLAKGTQRHVKARLGTQRHDISRVFFFGQAGGALLRLGSDGHREGASWDSVPNCPAMSAIVRGYVYCFSGKCGSPHRCPCGLPQCARRLWGGTGRHLGGIWVPTGRTGNEFRPDWFAQMPPYAPLYPLVPLFFRKFYSWCLRTAIIGEGKVWTAWTTWTHTDGHGQPAVARKLWRGALQRKTECQQSGGHFNACGLMRRS
jgi:hypothetical protein